MHCVKTALVAVVLTEVDSLAEHVEELVHCGAVASIAKKTLLSDLPVTLVDQAELVVVDDHVLVVGDDQFRGTRTQDWLELLQGQVGTEKPKECREVKNKATNLASWMGEGVSLTSL